MDVSIRINLKNVWLEKCYPFDATQYMHYYITTLNEVKLPSQNLKKKEIKEKLMEIN